MLQIRSAICSTARSLSHCIAPAQNNCSLHRFCTNTQLKTSPTKLAPPTSNKKIPSLSTPYQDSPQNIATRRTDLVSRHISTTTQSTAVNMSYGKQPSEFSVRKIGQPYTLDFRAYIEKDGQPISPFHDVPLYANEQQTILNMVVEIPRWTNAKLEVCQISIHQHTPMIYPLGTRCCQRELTADHHWP